MIRSLIATLIAVVFVGSLAVPVRADSASTGTLTGTGTTTPTSTLGVFDSSFTGSGTNSVSGPFTTTNMGTLTFTSLTTFIASGTFVDVFSDGTLFGTFTDNGTEVGGGVADVTIITLFTGGTGIFADVTGGEATVTGTSTATSSTTSSFTGTSTGFITTPEPSSLGLLLAGIGLMFVLQKRIGQSLP
jgi:PEP-CTERM motif